ncbi:hypothetical protein MTX34_08550 [Rhodococcus sp. ARC_M5]|nr:hypothetical protein [Rhodococcus sp. ARC_M5]
MTTSTGFGIRRLPYPLSDSRRGGGKRAIETPSTLGMGEGRVYGPVMQDAIERHVADATLVITGDSLSSMTT